MIKLASVTDYCTGLMQDYSVIECKPSAFVGLYNVKCQRIADYLWQIMCVTLLTILHLHKCVFLAGINFCLFLCMSSSH